MDSFDYIWNLLPTNQKELEQLAESGLFYVPYIPLQITRINMNDEKFSSGELVSCDPDGDRCEPRDTSLDGVEIRTDFWEMLNEIKAYTKEHPGMINCADIPIKLMLGFVHDDGKYWAIGIANVKKSLGALQQNSEDLLNLARSELLSNAIRTSEGKRNLCLALSNPVKDNG